MQIFQRLNMRGNKGKDTLTKRISISNQKRGSMPNLQVSYDESTFKKQLLGINISVQKQLLPERNTNSFLLQSSVQARLIDSYTCIISKDSRLKNIFDALIEISIVCSILTSLLFLAYPEITDTSSQIYEDIIWGLFILDFILNFMTEFEDEQQQKVRDFKEIARNYAKKWMLFDLLSIIPLRFSGNPNAERFLRLFRIFKANRLVNRVDISKISEFILNLFFKAENRSKKRAKIAIVYFWDLLKELILMLFATFCIACFWIYYAKLVIRYESENTNYFELNDLKDKSIFSQFLITWYYIFSTMMTVGYGDYSATNKFEMCFSIILLLAGPSWFAFVMSNAISAIHNMQSLVGKPDKAGKLNEWLSQIQHIAGPIPSQLKKKINQHFLNHFKNDRLDNMACLQMSEEDMTGQIECEIFKELPQDTQDLLIKYLFGDVFYRFKYFFQYFDEKQYQIALSLLPRVFRAGEVIVRIDRLVKEVTFIDSGVFELGIYSEKGYLMLYRLDQPFLAGEYFLFNEIPALTEFKAVTTVQGFGISSSILRNLLKPHKANVNKYLETISKCYKGVKNQADKLLSQKNQETEEVDALQTSRSNKQDPTFKGIECFLNYGLEDGGILNVLASFEKIEKGVESMKDSRKNLGRYANEKFADLIMKRFLVKKEL